MSYLKKKLTKQYIHQLNLKKLTKIKNLKGGLPARWVKNLWADKAENIGDFRPTQSKVYLSDFSNILFDFYFKIDVFLNQIFKIICVILQNVKNILEIFRERQIFRKRRESEQM